MRLQLIVCRVLQREAYYCAARSPHIVDIVPMEQGLHEQPDQLRRQLQKTLKTTRDPQGQGYDASLLGYGLCSNGIVGLSAEIPIVVPRGHDCITLLLGSKDRYQEYFDSHRGVYWYSPGWIEAGKQPGEKRDKQTREQYERQFGPDNAQYLMEQQQNWIREYQWATYVGWPIVDSEPYKQYTKDCAEFLDWQYDEIQGDPRLLQKLVDGDWNEEEFLVINPGGKIADDPTGQGIIKAE